jgi:hypothetical protein
MSAFSGETFGAIGLATSGRFWILRQDDDEEVDSNAGESCASLDDLHGFSMDPNYLAEVSPVLAGTCHRHRHPGAPRGLKRGGFSERQRSRCVARSVPHPRWIHPADQRRHGRRPGLRGQSDLCWNRLRSASTTSWSQQLGRWCSIGRRRTCTDGDGFVGTAGGDHRRQR